MRFSLNLVSFFTIVVDFADETSKCVENHQVSLIMYYAKPEPLFSYTMAEVCTQAFSPGVVQEISRHSLPSQPSTLSLKHLALITISQKSILSNGCFKCAVAY
jgi:hypothetical protein